MKPDNFFAPALKTPVTPRNPRGAGRKKQGPKDILYRRIDTLKKDRITRIVDAAIDSDEALMALEWVLAQYEARKAQPAQ